MSKKTLTYYHNLDGLRGVAAIAVILFHFFHNSAVTQDLMFRSVILQITEFGQHGVMLFFVLSGFVITRILLNTKEDGFYFYRFYKNRALRIFPLYYLYLLLHYNLFPYLFTEIDFVELKRQLPYFFYIQGFTWLTGSQAHRLAG